MRERPTLMAKSNVNAIEPKYAAVNGSRGPESRCWAYCTGPIKMAHEAKNSTDPIDHLSPDAVVSIVHHNHCADTPKE